ncbi:MAG TPA: bifunctional adenosylcobinamide kinase/adenosylcobinamide-phosphate guanylyltransferase [Methylocella sp.]|nr:bifunctional adenosylcobinamide kinase/adenosylcobinamide-phosphate guanylyltransferase [Methylocella sp.]
MTKSLLLLGGARSGKSRFAQQLAEASGRSPVLIATAEALDEEMADRITSHAASRGERWTLIEEPVALTAVLGREARADRILVIDCLTLWLSKLILEKADVAGAARELAGSIGALAGPVIFVSNEVGLGIVPENVLARRFRDEQGRLNQAMAAACEAVVLVTAGLPLCLKPSPGARIFF